MSNSAMQRRQIEENILTQARSVNTHDARWLEGSAFAKLVEAWHDLARYYERSKDTTLDAHVLKLYMRYAVTLRRISEDERITQRLRLKAKAYLRDLNTNLDMVFNQIERNGGARTAV